MTANKRVFGLTGPTGSGKSYVAKLFEEKGVMVIDCDLLAREIVKPQKPAWCEIKTAFGEGYFDKEGNLLRRKLAETVFSDEEKLGILNGITHKHIDREIKKIIDKTDGIILIDGAVIIGSPVEKRCEFLVGVLAPEEVRIKRLLKRDKISEEQIKKRISSQENDEFYKKHCHFIIQNDSTGDLKSQIKEILDILS
ncbi:MAG: dephospho-CoA kinase [Clostridia bacterium]|nr:dephospho-CoA kinase [Clostridia bacterium]